MAFLAGHFWFMVAFYTTAGLKFVAAVGAPVFTAIGIIFYLWLRPYLELRMKGPVAAYIIVISLMLSMAVSRSADQSLALGFRFTVIAGALAIYISDIFVARNQFITIHT